MKKTINGIEFTRSVSGVWYSPNNAYSVSRHDTLRTKYTLRDNAGNAVKHSGTIGELLTYAVKLINVAEAEKAESERVVASVEVRQQEITASVQTLQVPLLLERCESLSPALRRLSRLVDEFTEAKKQERKRKQGELLLSAVGCLRLSVLVLSACVRQRSELVRLYKQHIDRLGIRMEQTQETVLRAKTYQTRGMFPRTETDYNEEKSISENLSILTAGSTIWRDSLVLNQSGLEIVRFLNSAEQLVGEFCKLRDSIISLCPAKSGKNASQNKLLSILLASEHSEQWEGRKNNQNTICGVNGKLIDSIETWYTDKKPDSELVCGLRSGGQRIVRATIEKTASKTHRVSANAGQRIVSNSRYAAAEWWKRCDELSIHDGFNPEKLVIHLGSFSKTTGSDYQWGRQCLRLHSELAGYIPAVHPLTKYAASAGLIPADSESDSVSATSSILVRGGQPVRILGVSDRVKLRFLLRLRKTGLSARRLASLQRFRSQTLSAVCSDYVSQVVLTTPQNVGTIVIQDSTGETVSLPIVRYGVLCLSSDENVEYGIGGELPEFWQHRLCPMSRFSNHRSHVTTYHAIQGVVANTPGIPAKLEQVRPEIRQLIHPAEDATDTDIQGLIVLMSRCLDNLTNYTSSSKPGETLEETKRKQRKAKSDILVRLLRLNEVSLQDSLSSGNCKAGTLQFMKSIGLSENTETVSGAKLARIWKTSGYPVSPLFERVIQTAENRKKAGV